MIWAERQKMSQDTALNPIKYKLLPHLILAETAYRLELLSEASWTER